MPAAVDVEPLRFTEIRRRLTAMFMGSIGNFVEWYDFYAYTAFALYFANAFFPGNFRHGANETYRWEFDKGKQSLAVAVDGPLVVDDVQLLIRAAIDGVGLTFLMEEHAAPYLANGRLLRVVEEWCEPFPGTSSTIRAGASSRLRWQPSSTLFASRHSDGRCS